CFDVSDSAGTHYGGDRVGVAESGRVWFPGRRSGLRVAVWSWNRHRNLGKAGDQPHGFAGAFARNKTWDGFRAGNILAFERWVERGAHRGRNRGDGNWSRSYYALSRGKINGGGRALSHGGGSAGHHARERSRPK